MSEQKAEAMAPEMVEFFVDGEPVQAQNGQNLLEAMLAAGEEVSYFCYHPGLSVVAKCRQCLVGMGDAHKLVPACQLNVKEGMQIRSKTEQVRDARRALLEFTLVNHPVDCVICDKAGECALQRQYMDHDGEASLVNHDKVHKPKRVDLGPTVVLDAERCILCDRCVRFCSEVAKEPQLLFAKRGDHTEVCCAPGQKLDNPYSLNVVDICPVGALTDKDFRFKSRVWDLWSTQTVCQGCAAGCEMEIHHKDGDILRLVPPKKWDMNTNWMCDYGRSTHKELAAAERLTSPLVSGHPTDPEVAISKVAEGLTSGLEEPQTMAFVLGADTCNEDAFAAALLARELGTKLYLGDWPDDQNGDEILRRNDPNPNRTGVLAIGGADMLSLEDLCQALSDGAIDLLYLVGNVELPGSVVSQLETARLVVSQSPVASALTGCAEVVLPVASWAEVNGTVTDGDGQVKRMRPAFEPPGHARPHWDWINRVAAMLQRSRHFSSAEEIFETMQGKIAAFASASWGPRLPTKRLRFGGRRG